MPHFIMPACMGGVDIVMLLAIMLVGSVGLLFLAYWPYRWAMNELAAGPLLGKPLGLFIVALLGGMFWVGLTIGMVGLLIESAPVAVFILGLVGAVGLCAMIIGWLLTRWKRREPSEAMPVPPLQVWMQDLVVAVLCYGAGLTLVSAMNDFNRERAAEVLPYAIYLLVAGTIGLFAALDVSRRSEAAQRALPRAGLFVGIFTLFPVTLPISLIAWWRWRRALRRSAAE